MSYHIYVGDDDDYVDDVDHDEDDRDDDGYDDDGDGGDEDDEEDYDGDVDDDDDYDEGLSYIVPLSFDSSMAHPTEQVRFGKNCTQLSAPNRWILPIIQVCVVFDSAVVHPTEQDRLGKTHTNTHRHTNSTHQKQPVQHHTLDHRQSTPTQ